jgi:hypothetical protein
MIHPDSRTLDWMKQVAAEPVAIYNGVFHYTINANGEMTSWVDEGTWGWDCL